MPQVLFGSLLIGLVVGLVVQLVRVFFIDPRAARRDAKWPFTTYSSVADLIQRQYPSKRSFGFEIPFMHRAMLAPDPDLATEGLLFRGPPGVGKTREALEWMRQLEIANRNALAIIQPKALGPLEDVPDPRPDNIPADTRALALFLDDAVRCYGLSDPQRWNALKAFRDRMRRLFRIHVIVVATARGSLCDPTLPSDTLDAVALDWLTKDHSRELIRKTVTHHQIAADEASIEALANAADGTAVSLVAFLQSVKALHAKEVGVYDEEWRGKDLLPLLRAAPPIAQFGLAVIGHLQKSRLPSPILLHKAAFRWLQKRCPLAPKCSYRQALAALLESELASLTRDLLYPFHDLLADTAARELSAAEEQHAFLGFLTRSLRLWPKAPRVHALFVRGRIVRVATLAYLGRRLNENGIHDYQVDVCGSIALLLDNSSSAWTAYGAALAVANRLPAARGAIDRALRIDPNNAAAWKMKGYALVKAYDLTMALPAFERSLALDPHNADAWRMKGDVLLLQRDPERLIRKIRSTIDYANALDSQAQGAEAEERSRLSDTETDDLRAALAAYDEALKIDPNNSDAWHQKAITLHRLGRDDEALVAVDRALNIHPKDADSWDLRSDTLHRLGRNDEAFAAIDCALKIDPNNASRRVQRLILERRASSSNRVISQH